MITAIKGWRERANLPASYEITGPSAVERALLEENAELRKASGWISVDERLPEKYIEVIVWPYPTDYCMTAELFGESASGNPVWKYGEYTNGWGHENVEITWPVTHWMPLPADPTSEASA